MPDREIAAVEAWLADRPEIKILSRDRGGGYLMEGNGVTCSTSRSSNRWDNARHGVTGHGVRYVLLFGLLGVIVAFAVLLIG